MFSVTPTLGSLLPVHAASWIPTEGTHNESLNLLIRNVLNTAIIAVGVIATFYLVWAGIKYIMSGGDSAKAKEAQQGISSTVIGTVVALVAFVVVQFIYTALDAPFVTDLDNAVAPTNGATVIIQPSATPTEYPTDTPTPSMVEGQPSAGPIIP